MTERYRAWLFQRMEHESDRKRDWDWHVFWWSGVVFHINAWCLCCQVPEIWFKKERREKKGKGMVDGGFFFLLLLFSIFFFMWRCWQLPCIALSLNNGMLICITRDVITSTVKRKHNNSSSAPPWDRLGWPTFALWRDALELRLSQAQTPTHTYTRSHSDRVTHSRKLSGAQRFCTCGPALLSAVGLFSENTVGNALCLHTHRRAFIQMLLWYLQLGQVTVRLLFDIRL